MADTLMVFRSLNCSICHSPYSKTQNDLKSPVKVGCGMDVCRKCCERDKALKVKDRQHRCCHGDKDCYDWVAPAYFLIDLLNHPSIAESPTRSGYLLIDEMETPKCRICFETLSTKDKSKWPRVCPCGYVLCHSCLVKILKKFPSGDGSYLVECPFCQRAFEALATNPSPMNRYYHFLREIPFLHKQIPLAKIAKQLECCDCNRKMSMTLRARSFLTEPLHCVDCGKTVCLWCNIRLHAKHKTRNFFKEQVRKITSKMESTLGLQGSTYRFFFVQLNEQIFQKIDDFEEKLKTGMRRVEAAKTWQTVLEEQEFRFSNQKIRENLRDTYAPFEKNRERNRGASEDKQ